MKMVHLRLTTVALLFAFFAACGGDAEDGPPQSTGGDSAMSDHSPAADAGSPVPFGDAATAADSAADSALTIADTIPKPASDASLQPPSDSGVILPTESGCLYAGISRKPGDQFPSIDGCNTCSCTKAGTIACTEMACPCTPSQEWFQHYEMTDVAQCATSMFSCPLNTVRFDNTCGCGCRQSEQCPKWFNCMPPKPCDVPKIKEACPYSGIAY